MYDIYPPSRLVILVPLGLTLAAFAWLDLAPDVELALMGWGFAIAVVAFVAFGLNARTVAIDRAAGVVHIRRHIPRQREEVQLADLAEVKERTGRGAGIWLVRRDGSRVAIPYAGVAHGRKLYEKLVELHSQKG